jgi:hypothetical protein
VRPQHGRTEPLGPGLGFELTKPWGGPRNSFCSVDHWCARLVQRPFQPPPPALAPLPPKDDRRRVAPGSTFVSREGADQQAARWGAGTRPPDLTRAQERPMPELIASYRSTVPPPFPPRAPPDPASNGAPEQGGAIHSGTASREVQRSSLSPDAQSATWCLSP